MEDYFSIYNYYFLISFMKLGFKINPNSQMRESSKFQNPLLKSACFMSRFVCFFRSINIKTLFDCFKPTEEVRKLPFNTHRYSDRKDKDTKKLYIYGLFSKTTSKCHLCIIEGIALWILPQLSTGTKDEKIIKLTHTSL